MMKFEIPAVEVVTFAQEDVIATSSVCSGDCQTVCSDKCLQVTPLN